MEDNKKQAAERSLEIISEAIRRSRREAGRSVGTWMTAWGTLGAVTGIAIVALWSHTGDARWQWLWAVAAVLGYACQLYLRKRNGNRRTPETFATSVIRWVWTTFAGIALCAVFFSFDFIYSVPPATEFPVYSVIIFLLCMAGGITGMVTSNGAGLGSAVIGIYYAKIAYEESGCGRVAALVMACVFTLLIPGVIRKYKTFIEQWKTRN